MSDNATPASTPGDTRRPADEQTIGGLVNQLTTQIPQLIRSEIRLAQAELTEKGKRAGTGIGMFSAAGLLAFYALGFLFATAAAALATVLPAWAGIGIVTLVLFALAGIVALVGKKKVNQATPAAPERAIAGVKEDVATIKGEHS